MTLWLIPFALALWGLIALQLLGWDYGAIS